MSWLATQGESKIYYEFHKGTERPMLLIHGWGMSSRVWDGTIATLRARGHAVLAFDQRGCGQSDKDFTDLSIEALATDAVALVEKLDLRAVAVNGWSLGGAVATEAAARLGERCGGLILTCAAVPRYTRADDFPYGQAPADVAGIPALLQADKAGFLRNVANSVCAKPVDAAVPDWLFSIFMQAGPTIAESITSLATCDQRNNLRQLSAPVLALVGTADSFTAPELGEETVRIARHATLVRFEGCGHAPFLEDPAGYEAALAGFLARLDGKAHA